MSLKSKRFPTQALIKSMSKFYPFLVHNNGMLSIRDSGGSMTFAAAYPTIVSVRLRVWKADGSMIESDPVVLADVPAHGSIDLKVPPELDDQNPFEIVYDKSYSNQDGSTFIRVEHLVKGVFHGNEVERIDMDNRGVTIVQPKEERARHTIDFLHGGLSCGDRLFFKLPTTFIPTNLHITPVNFKADDQMVYGIDQLNQKEYYFFSTEELGVGTSSLVSANGITKYSYIQKAGVSQGIYRYKIGGGWEQLKNDITTGKHNVTFKIMYEDHYFETLELEYDFGTHKYSTLANKFSISDSVAYFYGSVGIIASNNSMGNPADISKAQVNINKDWEDLSEDYGITTKFKEMIEMFGTPVSRMEPEFGFAPEWNKQTVAFKWGYDSLKSKETATIKVTVKRGKSSRVLTTKTIELDFAKVQNGTSLEVFDKEIFPSSDYFIIEYNGTILYEGSAFGGEKKIVRGNYYIYGAYVINKYITGHGLRFTALGNAFGDVAYTPVEDESGLLFSSGTRKNTFRLLAVNLAKKLKYISGFPCHCEVEVQPCHKGKRKTNASSDAGHGGAY